LISHLAIQIVLLNILNIDTKPWLHHGSSVSLMLPLLHLKSPEERAALLSTIGFLRLSSLDTAKAINVPDSSLVGNFARIRKRGMS
jgi:hypothetical protein